MPINSIDSTNSTSTASTKKAEDTDSLDKDAFLQLLVTQMKNQDPMNPSDNTEYMSQLAQFSSLEAMTNLNNTSTNNQALNLTGQYVIMNTTDSAGGTAQISGLVDFVTIKDGSAMLSINDVYYPITDLDSVVSLDYLKSKVTTTTDTKTT